VAVFVVLIHTNLEKRFTDLRKTPGLLYRNVPDLRGKIDLSNGPNECSTASLPDPSREIYTLSSVSDPRLWDEVSDELRWLSFPE
jgi:hypothetical protein